MRAIGKGYPPDRNRPTTLAGEIGKISRDLQRDLELPQPNANFFVLAVAPSSSEAPDGITLPGASTDEAIVRWDGVTGAIIQDSGVTINDSDEVYNQLKIHQTEVAGAIAPLQLEQKDTNEPFMKVIGTAAPADLTRSIVSEGDVVIANRLGWVKIEIRDDGNQITDMDYFIPVYEISAVEEYLLLESGDFILLEGGDKIIL